MATFTLTLLPILVVLRQDRKIGLKELSDTLTSACPERFDSMETVEWAIDNYTACLKIEDGSVVYDRTAKSFGKCRIMEESIRQVLYGTIPKREEWDLHTYNQI